MITRLIARLPAVSLVGLFFMAAGCGERGAVVGTPATEATLGQQGGTPTETRGTFTAESCAMKVPVPAAARSAIYFNAAGQPLGTRAEDLTGTESKMMCETPEYNLGPGTCPLGYCPLMLPGVTYCLRC
jgi:hypothetical protein